MTTLRLAIAIAVSLALHAALAAVIGENVDGPVAGADTDTTTVTLVLLETQSDVEDEAAPSPEPGAETDAPAEQMAEAAEAAENDKPEKQEKTADAPMDVVESDAVETRNDPEPDVAESAVAKQTDEPAAEELAETAPAEPQQVAALPAGDVSEELVAPTEDPGPETAAPEGAEPEIILPETVAVVPRARPTQPATTPAPQERKPEAREKPSPQQKKAEQARPAPKQKQSSAGDGGRNSIGSGKAATARSSARAIAAYGRRINAHVARHKQAARGRGTVAVTIRVNRSGRLVGASLASSSGDPVLDRAAIATARRAAPYPSPPDDVPGSTIALRIRLSYR